MLTAVRHISRSLSTTRTIPIASTGKPIAPRMTVMATRLADGMPAMPMEVNKTIMATVTCIVISITKPEVML